METACCDIANNILCSRQNPPPAHRLESVAARIPPLEPDAGPAPCAKEAFPPIGLNTAMNSFATSMCMLTILSSSLKPCCITDNAYFVRPCSPLITFIWPLSPTDFKTLKEVASVNKTLNGDASWTPFEQILGWDLYTQSKTIHLPSHRTERLRELLQWLQPPQKRLAIAKWQQLRGELRSIALVALRDWRRVRLNLHVYDVAADFVRWPTRLLNVPCACMNLHPPRRLLLVHAMPASAAWAAFGWTRLNGYHTHCMA
jgi:hypothetical protein